MADPGDDDRAEQEQDGDNGERQEHDDGVRPPSMASFSPASRN
jgi:hypothetical protein